jgi:hypothetical protein
MAKKIKHLSKETRRKISEAQKGDKGNNWKGDNITYNSLHWWIRRNYGSANKCENHKCEAKSNIFEWALLKGKNYERKRGNFWQLCRKCHFNYDLRDYQKEKFNEGRKLARIARLGIHHSDETKNKIKKALKLKFPDGRSAWNKGKKWSEEAKLKMSLAHKGKIPWNKGLKIH